jgi:hypothetical protein
LSHEIARPPKLLATENHTTKVQQSDMLWQMDDTSFRILLH